MRCCNGNERARRRCGSNRAAPRHVGGARQGFGMIGHAAIPTTIATLPRRQALAFLSLFFVPGVAQAILLTVVPLEALRLLGTARTVTLFYVGIGLVAVAG